MFGTLRVAFVICLEKGRMVAQGREVVVSLAEFLEEEAVGARVWEEAEA
jgi:hypothetical protein